MRPALIRIALAAATISLAACGSDPAPEQEDDGRTAEGEVLGGSISDEMLPLDSRTSQSPTIREAPAPSPAASPEGAGEEEPEAEPPPPPAPPSEATEPEG